MTSHEISSAILYNTKCMMTSSNGNISGLLAICAGNSPVTGEFPAQRPVTRSFDVFFELRLNKRLSKQSWVWWFETPSRPVWHHCNGSVNRHWNQLYDPRITSLFCYREHIRDSIHLSLSIQGSKSIYLTIRYIHINSISTIFISMIWNEITSNVQPNKYSGLWFVNV